MNMYVLIFLVSVGIVPLLAVDLPIELDWDRCGNPRTVNNFNAARFAGIWYDIQRYKNALLDGDCATANFQWNRNREFYNMTYANLDSTEDFELRPQDLRNGELRIYRRGRRTPVILYVLDTDYDNYAVLWSCTDVMYGVGSAQTLNIFSRSRTLDFSSLSTAKDAIRDRDLDVTRLRKVTQDRSTCRRRRDDYYN